MSRTANYVAEAIGTFALCLVGAGAICVTKWKGFDDGGGLVAVALAHGLILGVGISATMNISGGHLNPAVTVAMLATRRISVADAIGYILSQLAGGVIAGLLVYLFFKGLVTADKQSVVAVAALGTPAFTAGDVTAGVATLIELLMTFLLVFAVFGTAADPRAHRIGGFGIGLTLTACIFISGPLTGAALNPARTFGTGLVAAMTDNMPGFWSQHWVYWVGPIAGGVIAGLIYDRLLMPRASTPPASVKAR